MSDLPTPLPIIQGVPVEVTATVTGGAALWPDGTKVKGEIRTEPGGTVLLDLTPHLTATVSGADVVVSLKLTGAVTRTVRRSGEYDVFVSEPGDEYASALRVLHGPAPVELAVTA